MPLTLEELRQPAVLPSQAAVDPNGPHIADVPVCGPRDTQTNRLWLNPSGSQLITTSLLNPNDFTQMPQDVRDRMLDIDDGAWQRIFGLRGDFLYSSPIVGVNINGEREIAGYTTAFQPICRDATPAS